MIAGLLAAITELVDTASGPALAVSTIAVVIPLILQDRRGASPQGESSRQHIGLTTVRPSLSLSRVVLLIMVWARLRVLARCGRAGSPAGAAGGRFSGSWVGLGGGPRATGTRRVAG